jgi:hypothetical protein
LNLSDAQRVTAVIKAIQNAVKENYPGLLKPPARQAWFERQRQILDRIMEAYEPEGPAFVAERAAFDLEELAESFNGHPTDSAASLEATIREVVGKFVRRMKRAMKRKHLPVDKLASTAGISPESVRSVLACDAAPGAIAYRALIDALDLKPDEFELAAAATADTILKKRKLWPGPKP